ncbi:MAG: hypothetical protein A07HR60_01005 [uncultured archaeon A07HR60]|nr:MAG: hypothetical protein A07HR60_01005 [uncultured archaeon A07HR60]
MADNEQAGSSSGIEMTVIGWLIAAGISVFVFPMLPFILVGCLVWRLLNAGKPAPESEQSGTVTTAGVETGTTHDPTVTSRSRSHNLGQPEPQRHRGTTDADS